MDTHEESKPDDVNVQKDLEGLNSDGSTKEFKWPIKTREFHNYHFDSTMWNGFNFREDDIIIASYAKSGTNWMQQIISQLIYDGKDDLDVPQMSPWVDMRLPPRNVKMQQIEVHTHRLFLKTHLPVDALVFSPKVKYIYIGRDGRDVCWSFFNHQINANDLWYHDINDAPGRVGPSIGRPKEDVIEYFRGFVEKYGYPFWPFWENMSTWWDIRDLPNVMMLHFNDLKKDMEEQMRSIAKFLEIPINKDNWGRIVDHCKFDYMKKVRHLIVYYRE